MPVQLELPAANQQPDGSYTQPMGRAVLIDGPPTSTLRSLEAVNFHGLGLPRRRKGGEQIQLLPAGTIV